MAEHFMKRVFTALLAVVVLFSLAIPFAAFAKDWWIMETTYTVTGREPIQIAGPQSRIFLPDMTAATADDGIDMDMVYTVHKDGVEFASGDYKQGLYVDLSGAGTYVFTVKGVDALNDYSFTVQAKEENASLIHESVLPLSVNQEEAFQVPPAKIAVGEQIVDAQVQLLMASGSVYQYEGKALAESGLMQVKYSADIDGEEYSFTFDVDVIPSGLGFVDENGKFYAGGTKPYEQYEMTGALLNDSLARKYTFSQVLDISQMTTDIPLVVLSNGGDGAAVPFVRIVDAHDPTNYIEILGRGSADNGNMVYSVANAPGQGKIGHLGGVEYYNQNIFGTETVFPARGTENKDYPGIFYYDADEKAVYADWYGRISLISDFDADYQMKPWKGFTTGEVYIVIVRQNETDYICVESVCGISLNGSAKDTAPPVLTVDVDESNIPYAVVGKKFQVFASSAVDMADSDVFVETHVFKGSDANSGVELNIIDGCFVPYGPGYYTIVYFVSDRYGNVTEKRINVKAVNEEDVSPMTATVEGLPTSAFVGDKLFLPKAENISGGSGEVSCAIRMRAADGTLTPIQEEYVILPDTGVNTIEYVLTDYLDKETVISFPIDCTASATPILYDLEMPKYLQSGTAFTLPAPEYAEDATVQTNITATVDGVDVPVENNVVTPVTDKTKAELVVTYHATNAGGETTKSYVIQIFNGDMADRTTFFYTESGTLEKIQESNAIRFNTTQSGSGFRFISSVLADKMNLVMGVDPERNDSDRITVTLTDAYYPEVSVQIDIVKKPDGDDKSKSELYINGVQGNDMVGNFYGGVETLSVSYQKNSKTFVDAQGNSLGKITKDLSGNTFNGFPSGQVYITVSAGRVGNRGFSWNVMQINNQAFADDSVFFDNYPEIVVSGDLKLQSEIGGEIVAPAAYSVDVLSPNVTLSLTVRKGATPILENQPVDKDYTVKLEEYGKYYIVYNYAVGDFSRSVTYPVQIVEHTVPQVQMPSLPTEAALNTSVKLALPTVSDEYSVKNTVAILVQEPNYNMIRVNMETLTFEADQAGTYTVFYYVYDECSNYQVIRHTITVK